ncbi:hypothetical protein AGMMS49975_17270 [Clostridia bacterium]|nr:hypothetical protein AGMMS49975_17270 [Clostridia bacterium]
MTIYEIYTFDDFKAMSVTEMPPSPGYNTNWLLNLPYPGGIVLINIRADITIPANYEYSGFWRNTNGDFSGTVRLDLCGNTLESLRSTNSFPFASPYPNVDFYVMNGTLKGAMSLTFAGITDVFWDNGGRTGADRLRPYSVGAKDILIKDFEFKQYVFGDSGETLFLSDTSIQSGTKVKFENSKLDFYSEKGGLILVYPITLLSQNKQYEIDCAGLTVNAVFNNTAGQVFFLSAMPISPKKIIKNLCLKKGNVTGYISILHLIGVVDSFVYVKSEHPYLLVRADSVNTVSLIAEYGQSCPVEILGGVERFVSCCYTGANDGDPSVSGSGSGGESYALTYKGGEPPSELKCWGEIYDVFCGKTEFLASRGITDDNFVFRSAMLPVPKSFGKKIDSSPPFPVSCNIEIYLKDNEKWTNTVDIYVKNEGKWVKNADIYLKNNGRWAKRVIRAQ